jgi:hypothetical protein
MIELTFVILLNHVVNWGLAPIIVTRAVAADRHVLHAFLSDPVNHWRLAASFADVVSLQPAGDRCDAKLRLPSGMRWHASVQVKPSRGTRLLTAELRLGNRTIASATWILSADRGTTEVDLAIQPESRSLVTRLVLLLGGRRWIAQRVETALATLATTCARVAEDVVARPAADVVTSPAAPEQNSTMQAEHAPIHH